MAVAKGFGLGAGIGAINLLAGSIDNVVGLAGDFVQGAIEEETGIKRLTTAIGANVKGRDCNIAKIEEVIRQRIKLGFSDDEQRESLALLVAATGDVDEAMPVQATAMDLARFKGISLKEASEALVKVEAGSYRILKSLGIELRTGATRTEALAAVQRVAAGQAKAYGDTTAGAIAGMQASIDDAGEALAVAFLPAIRDVAVYIRDEALTALEDFGAEAAGLAETLSKPVARSLEGTERTTAIARAMREFAHSGGNARAAIDINQLVEAGRSRRS